MVVTMDKKAVVCMMVGDGMVGKTCLAKLFAEKSFPGNYVATVQDKFDGQFWYAGDQYDISIIDCAGQHEDDELRTLSYSGTEVFIICYSAVDRESFVSVKSFWAPEIKKMAKKRPVILAALQTDLRKGAHKYVTKYEGKKMAQDIGAEGFIECSSIQKEGVKDVFDSVVFSCLRLRKRKLNLMKRVLGR